MKKIVFSVALLAVLAGGGYAAYHFDLLKQPEAEQSVAAVETSTENRQAFEDFLNDFLKQVATEAQAYKQRRTVLVSLLQPENLKNSAYIQENEKLAEETTQGLQAQMDKIMSAFDQGDQKVAELVEHFAPEDRAGILESWKTQRDKRANQFLAYFTSEQEIIGAYNELLKLYADKRDAMSVDVANKKIMFTNPEDQVAADQITDKIAALSKAQRELLTEE